MSESIIYSSASLLVEKIKSKELSVVALIEDFYTQIEKYNPTINAIFDLRSKEDVLVEAKLKDKEVANGEVLGVLHGIPMTVKDSFLVKGLKTSNGDPMHRNYVAKEDAELIKRLKDAGVIIIGKTNIPLYCIDWQSTNFWNGQTNNPYDLSRVAGGSSGGSAASLAAGFTPLELGSDAGGSIRVPAHFCGIYGLRPTEGLLSNKGHLKAPGKPQGRRHIVTPGPFAKNVSDLMLMMEVLGNNSSYPLPEIPAIDYKDTDGDTADLNIAFSNTINNIEIDDEYAQIFNAFIAKLKSEQYNVSHDHPIFDEKKAYLECSKIIGFEMGVNTPRLPLAAASTYALIRLKYKDHLWAEGMRQGLRLSSVDYAKAIDYKDSFSTVFQSFLNEYDIWITPVCSFEAFPHQRAGKPFVVNNKKVPYTKAIASFVFTTAFSGHPIVVIPIGKKKNGMPVGIQIHAKKWTDKKLLEIAKKFESITYAFQPPSIPIN